MSTLPVGWSCRSRSPVEVPRNVLVTECSANPYSFRPADGAASNALAERAGEAAEHPDLGAGHRIIPARPAAGALPS